MIKKNKLSFAIGNAKLKGQVGILSLPAGWACPFAKLCHSKADKVSGKITDGKHTQFRCFATMPEALFKNVRNSRWHNWELLKAEKTVEGMASLIECSVPKSVSLVRLNASGDFFNQTYFDAWLLVAQRNPSLTIYGYTTALPFWIKRIKDIPSNLHLVASVGGTHDHLIEPHNLRHVKVVFTEDEANKMLLPIDHDDSLVWNYHGNFSVLLHGTQPKGSVAAKAWYQISKKGHGGYKSDYFSHYEKSKNKSLLVPAVSVKPYTASKRVINLFSSKSYAKI